MRDGAGLGGGGTVIAVAEVKATCYVCGKVRLVRGPAPLLCRACHAHVADRLTD